MSRQTKDYINVHLWIKSKLGKATSCKVSYKHSSKVFHWANISRKYLYELSDWIELCPMCHKIFDDNKLTVPQLLIREKEREKLLDDINNNKIDLSVSSHHKSQKVAAPIIYKKRVKGGAFPPEIKKLFCEKYLSGVFTREDLAL